MKPQCAVGPDGAPSWFAESVERGGGELVPIDAAEALLWYLGQDVHGDSSVLAEHLARATRLRWVQLSAAGIEDYAAMLDPGLTWTCAKGVYAKVVAEHALALVLAGLRRLPYYSVQRSWAERGGVNLHDANVVILGGGGIALALAKLLRPFRTRTTIVRRHSAIPMPNADKVVDLSQLHRVLPGADLVVVALALTPRTASVIGAAELDLMAAHAWIVNVARGAHIVTDDLVAALERGAIGGAALDVTDPEPLPVGHPLWALDNCLITPHTANAPHMQRKLLEGFTSANVRRFAAGEPLDGQVDVALGY